MPKLFPRKLYEDEAEKLAGLKRKLTEKPTQTLQQTANCLSQSLGKAATETHRLVHEITGQLQLLYEAEHELRRKLREQDEQLIEARRRYQPTEQELRTASNELERIEYQPPRMFTDPKDFNPYTVYRRRLHERKTASLQELEGLHTQARQATILS